MRKLLNFSLSIILSVSLLVTGFLTQSVKADETSWKFDDLKVETTTQTLKDETYVDVIISGYTGTQKLENYYHNGHAFQFPGEAKESSLELQSITLPYVKYTNKNTGKEYGTYWLLRGATFRNSHIERAIDATTENQSHTYTRETFAQEYGVNFDFTQEKEFTFYVAPQENGNEQFFENEPTLEVEQVGDFVLRYKVNTHNNGSNDSYRPDFKLNFNSSLDDVYKTFNLNSMRFADYTLEHTILTQPSADNNHKALVKFTLTNENQRPINDVNLILGDNQIISLIDSTSTVNGSSLMAGESRDFEIEVDAENVSSLSVALMSLNDVQHKTDFDPLIFSITPQSFTVNFDSNGGTIMNSIQVTKGDKITIPSVPTKLGYTFKGWYADIDLSNIWNFDVNTVISDLTLYAKWEKDAVVSTYDVTFDTQGGTHIELAKVEAGQRLDKPQNPSKPGFEFDGWFTDELMTIQYDFERPVTSNFTLYAKWKKVIPTEKYDVHFESNGGSPVESQLQLTTGSKIMKPQNPSKEGYTFEGWYTDNSLSKLWNFDKDLVSENMTLYAKWKKLNTEVEKFNVAFESNGGNTIDTQVGIQKGTRVIKPMDPKREGYTFEGWYSDNSFKQSWNFDTDTVESDMTLYAKWIQIQPEIEKPNPEKPNPVEPETVLPETGMANYGILSGTLIISGFVLILSRFNKKEN